MSVIEDKEEIEFVREVMARSAGDPAWFQCGDFHVDHIDHAESCVERAVVFYDVWKNWKDKQS